MSRYGQRGSTLVMALFISVLLLIVGLGFLGQREGQYQAAQEQVYFVRAKALADAGLQDALGKLAKDIEFPPIRSVDQSVFSYSEEMRDSGGQLVGTFRVSVNAKYRDLPYAVLEISSVGLLGDPADPLARVERSIGVDMSAEVRSNAGGANPNLFKTHYTRTNSL